MGDEKDALADEPFAFRATAGGAVFVSYRGRDVTTLRGRATARLLARIERMDAAAAQGEMARVTGNFKRGNERRAGSVRQPEGAS